MTEPSFKVVFSGALRPGVGQEEVLAGLAQLFKVEPSRLAGTLFTGAPVVIRKGLDAATALRYQAAMGKVGALSEVQEDQPPAPTVAPQAPPLPGALAPPAPAVARAALAAPKAPDYAVDAPGTLLDTSPQPTAPAIDTAHLVMAEAGVLLVEPQTIESPHYDLSALRLDPPGTRLSDDPPVPEAHFDLGHLQLVE